MCLCSYVLLVVFWVFKVFVKEERNIEYMKDFLYYVEIYESASLSIHTKVAYCVLHAGYSTFKAWNGDRC